MLGLSAVTLLTVQDADWLRLTDSVPSVGLYDFGCGESGGLAFRHSKVEYGID